MKLTKKQEKERQKQLKNICSTFWNDLLKTEENTLKLFFPAIAIKKLIGKEHFLDILNKQGKRLKKALKSKGEK